MYDNVFSALNGSIWATTEDKAAEVAAILDAVAAGPEAVERLRAAYEAASPQAGAGGGDFLASQGVFFTRAGTAVVPVRGTLMKRASLMSRYSGGTSTDALASTFDLLAADNRAKRVFLDVDSPGGAVNGVVGANAALSRLRAVKPVASMVNETMASGAYWLGSNADRVFTSETGSAGSVGVYVLHRDASKANETSDIKTTIIRAGKDKIVPNPLEPLSSRGVQILQSRVDKTLAVFTRAIASNRQISMADAKTMATGAVHMGEDAVSAGFADVVVSGLAEAVQTFEADEETTQVAVAADVPATPEPEAAAEPAAETFEEGLAADAEPEAEEEVEEAPEPAADAVGQGDDAPTPATDALAAAQAELAQARAELLVERNAKRIPPQRRAEFVAKATENYAAVEMALGLMGEAVPQGSATSDVDGGRPVQDVPTHAQDAEGRDVLVAYDETEADYYAQMGLTFVRK